jgi:hypothetical protein
VRAAGMLSAAKATAIAIAVAGASARAGTPSGTAKRTTNTRCPMGVFRGSRCRRAGA